ncbi:unnamed protein product [Penicillium olsonii]|uniref:Major facilitator superfamily (MFS) profile domain-containing protein n=1 Tax=Penicillium olsonii TaxID=99116 RepID=A0A9W4HKD5_PENOL|nr:unnamed protein product [Penicillium olsonii]
MDLGVPRENMADLQGASFDELEQPPGTFKLIRADEPGEHGQQVILLDPVPTSDPNEPLNWRTLRKSLNFTLVLAMTVLVFTALSIQAIFWQQMTVDMNVSYEQLNQAMSVNFAGLATGCVFFIPFARKYGRRPMYIVSTALMLGSTLWTARMNTLAELYLTNLLQGLAGATNEAIAEMTSFLTPMAAGVQATRQGWRSSYMSMGLFNGVLLLCFVFLYEETKYVPVLISQTRSPEEGRTDSADAQAKDNPVSSTLDDPAETETTASTHVLDHTIPLKSWRQRLTLATPSPEPLWPHFYRPVQVLAFPNVAFVALQYASCVVWLTVISNVSSLAFPLPPYSFSPEEVGYTETGPLIGNIIGAVYGGYLGDRSIVYYARRNNGYFEPEMRLYILHIPVIMLAGGLIMFGVTISKGLHWIWPTIAGAFFGFGLGSISDAVLVLVMDSYRDITGEAFTAVTFMRNAVSIGIPFAITPWMERQGTQNMFIVSGFVSLAVSATIIPVVLWGKFYRRASAARYRELVENQGE